MQKPDAWFDVAHLALRPGMAFWFNWRFEGMEHIPREGPVLIAGNHISYFDPLAHAYMLVKAGRHARFLAKKELYGNRLLRRALMGAGQIPVERGSGSMAPVHAAVKALQAGEAVMVYPEGTVTKDPDHLPMQGRTGIARLTLASEVPVLPLAVWGSQHVWQRGARSPRFGRPIWLKAGAPRDFSEFEDRRDDPEALRAVTDAIMADLTQLVADLRRRYPKEWES
ncbi:MAG: 1-acyl-sn-glycerol-3-phosphate acyltransferase [Actinobacteria bacterium]|nr:MAG: 1-acyl-sn-glycerol-3-phosphate acyltransferase [Actinomycetota bacterium]